MLIYLAMALDFLQWAHKAMDKIQWKYFKRGHKEAKGEHCLVAWDMVCRPTELGGLGISNLRNLGWALRTRWLWLQKTEPHRPWSNLEIQVPDQVRVFFSMAVISKVGNGERTMFWTDRWLQGQCIAEIAPLLFAAIPQRRKRQQNVKTALLNNAWTSNIQETLTIELILEYIQLLDLLNVVQLQPEVDDSHIWKLAATGKYSAKSNYESLFLGATLFKPYERVWKS
jgi:hypothetical protein